MYSPKIYEQAIKNAEKDLIAQLKEGLRGVEAIIRDEFLKTIPKKEKEKEKEVPLACVGTERLGGDRKNNRRTKMDIVADGHGIELKVVRLPRLKSVGPASALWDIGQLSGDYWSLARAKNLKSGELLVLLHGPLVRDLENAALRREFHNRLYVDFNTSLQFGEMKGPYTELLRDPHNPLSVNFTMNSEEEEEKKKREEEKKREEKKAGKGYYEWRKKQIKCIKEMGIDLPFDAKTASDMTVYRSTPNSQFALISMKVRMKK